MLLIYKCVATPHYQHVHHLCVAFKRIPLYFIYQCVHEITSQICRIHPTQALFVILMDTF